MHSLGAIRVLLSLTLLLKSITAQGVQQIDDLNPGDIPLATRQSWCKSQQQTCSGVCLGSGQQAKRDTCDYNILSSLCECDDGSFPDVSQFSNSLASLACNWQLNECITNSTSTPSSCQYQYLCGGRDPADALGASSTSASSFSTSYITTSTPSAADTARTGSVDDSTRRLRDSNDTPNYAWIAGPVLGFLALLVAIVLGLWWHKRRRRHQKEEHHKGPSRTSSTEGIWEKQELDGTPAQRSELSASSRDHVPTSPSDSCSELEGSIVQPVELDGSNPIPQELRTVSERLVRSNAYRSPTSPTSPLSQHSWTGEVSPAASTINETMYK